MAAPNRITGQTEFTAPVTFTNAVALPAGTVTNAMVAAGAGIAASKLGHRRRWNYTKPGTAASETVAAIEIYGTSGTILEFSAGSVAIAVGAATVTVDLKKNGSSILTSVITLDSANTARVMETSSLTSTTLAAGDFLEVVIVATAGGGTIPTGLLVQLIHDEDAA